MKVFLRICDMVINVLLYIIYYDPGENKIAIILK